MFILKYDKIKENFFFDSQVRLSLFQEKCTQSFCRINRASKILKYKMYDRFNIYVRDSQC